MSDFYDERPPKRPRRDSRSPPVRQQDVSRRRPSRDRRDHDKSPHASERRRRRQSQEREHYVERRVRRRSSSGDRESETEVRRPREHRSRSRDHDSYRGSRPHRHRDRSRTPESKEYEDHRKDRGRDRDGRIDRKPYGEAYQNDYRDRSREGRRNTNRDRDRDQDRQRNRPRNKDQDRRHRSTSPNPVQRAKAPLPSQKDAFTLESNPDTTLDKPAEKQKPNFNLTGKLAAASNTIQTANQSIVLKYHEPPEARKPPARDKWRLYIFKDDEILDTVELAEQSCWLFGREVAVADIPVEHASCSKQHAAVQFRYIEKRNEFGDKIGKVKPYIIDLESANGTTVNEDPVPAAKYVELIDKDVIRFGHSSREYVIQLPPSG